MSQCIRGSKVIVLRTFHLAFQKPQQSGAGERKNKVHYHGNGKGFKISIICTCNPFCCVEKLYNSNNGKNAGILDIDDEFAIDFRKRCEEQNGEINGLNYYSDQQIREYLTNENSLIILYTPLGMEVGINYDDGWATVTYKDYEKFTKQF